MTKLICIKTSENYYIANPRSNVPTSIEVGKYYYCYHYDDEYDDVKEIEDINHTFIGWFLKSSFLPVSEYRNQKINQILEND